MCFKATQGFSPRSFWSVASKLRSKKSKLRVSRLIRRRGRHDEKTATELVLRNLRLCIENRSIIEANEKLRQTASLLQQENTELTAQIRKKFP